MGGEGAGGEGRGVRSGNIPPSQGVGWQWRGSQRARDAKRKNRCEGWRLDVGIKHGTIGHGCAKATLKYVILDQHCSPD